MVEATTPMQIKMRTADTDHHSLQYKGNKLVVVLDIIKTY